MSFCTLVFPKFYVVPLRFLKFYFRPWRFWNFLLYPLVFEILSDALHILKFFIMPSVFRFFVCSTFFLPYLYILFEYDLCLLSAMVVTVVFILLISPSPSTHFFFFLWRFFSVVFLLLAPLFLLVPLFLLCVCLLLASSLLLSGGRLGRWPVCLSRTADSVR